MIAADAQDVWMARHRFGIFRQPFHWIHADSFHGTASNPKLSTKPSYFREPYAATRLCYNAGMTEQTKPASAIARFGAFLRNGPRAIKLRGYDAFHRRESGAPVWKYSEITPQLYVGGQHTRQGYAEMRKFGISAIVNMREARYCDIEGGIGGERHLHLPTVDHTPPSVADLMRGVEFISDEINGRKNAKVYIHCAAGCGRAPTMAAAYLVSIGDAPGDAWERIRKVRPFINPTATQKLAVKQFAAAWADGRAQGSCRS